MLVKKRLPAKELRAIRKSLKEYERKLKAFERSAKSGKVIEIPTLSFSK